MLLLMHSWPVCGHVVNEGTKNRGQNTEEKKKQEYNKIIIIKKKETKERIERRKKNL